MWQWTLNNSDLVVLGVQGLVLGLVWLLKRSFASKDEVSTAVATSRAEVDTKLAEQSQAMTAIAAAHTKTAGELALLEQKLNNVPTSEDFNQIKLSISEMEGDYKAISENVKNMKDHIGSIGRSVDRIEGWLMDGKGKTA